MSCDRRCGSNDNANCMECAGSDNGPRASENKESLPTDKQQTKAKITPHICDKIERCHNAGGKHCGSHQPCYSV
jgi:hypothetical protein